MKKRNILIAFLVITSSLLFANTSLAGNYGYIVIPSARVTPSSSNPAVTTSYTALLFGSGGTAHLPSMQLSFKNTFEVGLAVDIANDTDLLLNTKWRFMRTKDASTDFAVGLSGQLIGMKKNTQPKFAAQLYFASTFDNTVMNYPSKTTLLIGYSFEEGMNSNINFGLGFEVPFLRKTLKEKVTFVMDIGNVSYSVAPSAGNANDRGLVNLGLRLVPIEFIKSTFISADIRALDIFDHRGRALGLSASVSFRP